jgi:carbon storage regulator
MLVLSRKRLEQVVIGSAIRITVVKLEGTQVRLGIEAPEDLMILRAELVNEEAAAGRAKPARTPRRGKARWSRRGDAGRDQNTGPDGPVGC